MSSSQANAPSTGEVLTTVGQTVNELGAFVGRLLDEQPGTALAAAMGAGFVAGGGLASRLGARLTSATVRATLGNVVTLVALDLLRRGLEGNGAHGRTGSQAARAE
jgi:hypothetical protein